MRNAHQRNSIATGRIRRAARHAIALLFVPLLSAATEPGFASASPGSPGIESESAAAGPAQGDFATHGVAALPGATFVPDPVAPTREDGKVRVAVRITEPGPGVTGIDVDFRYDPLVLRAVSGSPSSALPGGWSGVVGLATPGRVGISVFGNVALPSSGEREIAAITFEVVSPCDPDDALHFTLVQFNETQICDEGNGSPDDDCTVSHAPGVVHGGFDLSCGVLRASENVIGRVGGYVDVPITLHHADATRPVAAVDMIVAYDATKLSYRGAFLGPAGPAEPMRGWNLQAFEYLPGKVDVGIYWSGPDGDFLSCSAVIATLSFAVGGLDGQTASVAIGGDTTGDGVPDWLHLNEGGVPSCTDDGYVTLTTEVCDGADNDGDGIVDEGGSALCDDGVWCNGEESCGGTNGCEGGTPPCEDGIACTDDTCLEAARGCVNEPIDGRCGDGNPCTADRCDPSSPDAEPDGCAHAEVPDHDPCDDGYACTEGDACLGGTCSGTPSDARCPGDGNACTRDVCAPHDAGAAPDGCYPYAPAGASCGSAADTACTDPDGCDGSGTCLANDASDGTGCSDDDLCTRPDTCQAGACVGGAPVICPPDGNACTSDSCAPSTGTCPYPPLPDRTPCDDGNSCTEPSTDRCWSGICQTVSALPTQLGFGGAAGGILDAGFTHLVPSTSGSYLPDRIDLDAPAGTLTIATTSGDTARDSSGSQNDQDNHLAIRVNAASQRLRLSARLVPPWDLLHDYQNAGVMFGTGEDAYVKLVVIHHGAFGPSDNDPTSVGFQLGIERSGSGGAVQEWNTKYPSSDGLLSVAALDLHLEVDPATGRATACYRANDGAITVLQQNVALNAPLFTDCAYASLTHTNNDYFDNDPEPPAWHPKFDRFSVSAADQDGDAFTVCQNDCDDSDPAVFPGAPEICDGKDNDCDGAIDEGLDADADGRANCFDNCVTVPNPDQANADGDACGDACDQAPLDPGVQTIEVGDTLRIDGHDAAVLTWGAETVPGPFAVYRGSRRPDVDWQYDHARIGAPVPGETATDDVVPPSGESFYYLVSRLGPCRESVLGRDSAGNPIPGGSPSPGEFSDAGAGAGSVVALADTCAAARDPDQLRRFGVSRASLAP